LSKSCRVSFSQIANEVNLSADEIGIRIQKLMNSRIIQKFTVALNPLLLKLKENIIIFRSLTPLDENRLTLLGIHPCVEYLSVGTSQEGFAYARYDKEKDLVEMREHFQQFHPTFESLSLFTVKPLINTKIGEPTQSLVSLEKLDWLILAHLREQGRLSLQELSTRLDLDVQVLVERIDFMRYHNLIVETIHINPVRSPKETLTLFQCEFMMLNQPIIDEVIREIGNLPYFWPLTSWKDVENPNLFLAFYCSSYTEVEKVQAHLTELPGLKSIEKIMGGSTFYFPDIRDELIEEKRSHGWFSPEKWVVP
jgi:DNA-binding Lrp family transcriptional regulator